MQVFRQSPPFVFFPLLVLFATALLVTAESNSGFVEKAERRVSVTVEDGREVDRALRDAVARAEETRSRTTEPATIPAPRSNEPSEPPREGGGPGGNRPGSIIQIS